jgi:thioredoxin 1
MGHVIHTTDSDFERDVLKSDLPALVDFWAEWCGPCKMIAPILDEAAGRYAGKLKITKLDVDANQRIPANFNIRSIPTLLLFKNGELVAQKVGALSKSVLAAWLDVQLQQSQPA